MTERFMSKVEYDTVGGCWLWAGGLDAYGYGHFKHQGRMLRAHRASWAFHKGSLPPGANTRDGVCVLHRCDVRSCVNPTHLFLGSRPENSVDMRTKGRGRYVFDEDHGHAVLTNAQVIEICALKGSMTQKQIGAIYGVSREHVGKLHRGERRRVGDRA